MKRFLFIAFVCCLIVYWSLPVWPARALQGALATCLVAYALSTVLFRRSKGN